MRGYCTSVLCLQGMCSVSAVLFSVEGRDCLCEMNILLLPLENHVSFEQHIRQNTLATYRKMYYN